MYTLALAVFLLAGCDGEGPGKPDVCVAAAETCDGTDDDCDGAIDEADATDAPTWYADLDADGFGDGGSPHRACIQPAGTVAEGGDCDDADPAVTLGGPWYADADGDGHGDARVSTTACAPPVGSVADATDCDDADGAAFPGGVEVCDGADNDCDGGVDDGGIGTAWYADLDGDGFGDAARAVVLCDAPGAHVADATDCDDSDPDINPDAVEVCRNGTDDDCDGAAPLCGLTGTIELSEAEAKMVGEGMDDCAGSSVAGAGDLNGDGRDDVLVGAFREDTGGSYAGAAYVLYGPLGGEIDLSAADAMLYGPEVGAGVGEALAPAGDVDGDGLDDLLLGAPGASSVNGQSGAAYLVLGPAAGTRSLADAHATLFGEHDRDKAGHSVAAAGDVNGDGGADLLVGAYHLDDNGDRSGGAYLVLGPVTGEVDLAAADARLLGEAEEDYAGWSVAGPGDVNGDGWSDLLIGARSVGTADQGAAYVVHGPVDGTLTLSDAEAKLVGDQPSEYAAWSMDGAGDVDGDGRPDLLVGAPENGAAGERAGVAYLVLAGVSGELDLSAADARLLGEYSINLAAYSVAGAGDVNADGFADLLVGAHGDGTNGGFAGAAYVVLGPISGTLSLTDADAKILGETEEDYAGRSVAGAGDVDGDGRVDVLIGAENHDAGGEDAGAAYLLYGGGL